MTEKKLMVEADSPWMTTNERINTKRLKIERIPKPILLDRLDLHHSLIPTSVLDSVLEDSHWFDINDSQNIIEVRGSYRRRNNVVVIADFDDCLFSATQWHRQEYELLAQDSEILTRTHGIAIHPDLAREIYEMSKILIPGKVTKEKRYTPMLNVALVSKLVRLLESGLTLEDAHEGMRSECCSFLENMNTSGDIQIRDEALDPAVVRLFASNSPNKYVHQTLVDDIKKGTEKKDLRIIATRGNIEGFLGQVYKVHASGVLCRHSGKPDFDIVVYTNDVKVEALLLLSRLVPWINTSLVRVLDDNPSEVLPYVQFTLERGVKNLEIIHVRHSDSKRSDLVVNAEPILQGEVDHGSGSIFDIYSYPDSSLSFVI